MVPWCWSGSVTMTAGWSRSCFARLSLSDDINSHVLWFWCTSSIFSSPFFCLSFWHTAGGGLKRRGKISLVYSQERKKLVKQIIWIFTAARFNGRHLYKNCRFLPLVLLLFTLPSFLQEIADITLVSPSSKTEKNRGKFQFKKIFLFPTYWSKVFCGHSGSTLICQLSISPRSPPALGERWQETAAEQDCHQRLWVAD